MQKHNGKPEKNAKKMNQSCEEQILYDIVRVDLVPAEECDLLLPFQVAATETPGTKTVDGTVIDRIGKPVLTISLSSPEPYITDSSEMADEGNMFGTEKSPTLDQKESRQIGGSITTHTLSAVITDDLERLRDVVYGLRGRDIHIVLYTEGGERYLCQSLPNTSKVVLTESKVLYAATLQVEVVSSSHVIHLRA